MIELPKSWNEISIQTYLDILDFYKIYKDTEYDILEFNIELISIITNIDIDGDEINSLTIDDISSLINQLSFINQPPSSKFLIDISPEFKFKTFEALTLGEFIDIEFFFANNYIDNLTNILTILYRKYKTGPWNQIEFEPYDVIDYITRKNEFVEIPIGYVYGILNAYLQFRKEFTERYSLIFEPEIEENDEDGVIDPRILQMMAENNEEKNELEEKIQQKWSWESMIYQLANNDITKVNEITDLGLIFVFNMLALRKEMSL
jgi:hypothetical protein